MPTRNQSWKPEHAFQNPSRKTPRSGKKYPKVIKAYKKLLQREKKEGATKRIVDAKQKAEARMEKYGIKKHEIVVE